MCGSDIAVFLCNKVTSQGKRDLVLRCPRLAQLKSIFNGLCETDSHIQVLTDWLVQLVSESNCVKTLKKDFYFQECFAICVGLQESDVIDLLLKKLFASSFQQATENGDCVNMRV